MGPESAVGGEVIDLSALATTTGAGPVTYAWEVINSDGMVVVTPAAGQNSTFSYTPDASNPVEVLTVKITATDTTTGQTVIETREITVVNHLVCPDSGTAGIVGTATVTSSADSGAGSLREAIDQANASAEGTFVIEIAEGVNPTLRQETTTKTATPEETSISGKPTARLASSVLRPLLEETRLTETVSTVSLIFVRGCGLFCQSHHYRWCDHWQ